MSQQHPVDPASVSPISDDSSAVTPLLVDMGGDAGRPVMQLAIANGFPPQTYQPLMDHFTDGYRVVSLPPRALWGDEPPGRLMDGDDWRSIAADMLWAMDAHDLRDVVAIGHSFGGVATLIALQQQPERFRAVVLLDPTILPQTVCEMFQTLRNDGTVESFPMVQGALNRRSQFDSADAAFGHYRQKSLFAGWPDATLRLYAEHGTRPSAYGGVELELVAGVGSALLQHLLHRHLGSVAADNRHLPHADYQRRRQRHLPQRDGGHDAEYCGGRNLPDGHRARPPLPRRRPLTRPHASYASG